MSRAAFERAPSAIAGDLHDSIALLWRQDLIGLPVGARDGSRSPRSRGGRLDRQGLLFHAAHLAMALAGAGDWATADTQLGMLRAARRQGLDGARGRRAHPARRGARGVRASGATARPSPGSSRSDRASSSSAGAELSGTSSTTPCWRLASAPATGSAPRVSWPSASPAAPTTTGSTAAALRRPDRRRQAGPGRDVGPADIGLRLLRTQSAVIAPSPRYGKCSSTRTARPGRPPTASSVVPPENVNSVRPAHAHSGTRRAPSTARQAVPSSDTQMPRIAAYRLETRACSSRTVRDAERL